MINFIKNLEDVFDDLDIKSVTSDTRFRDNDEWSSLHALAMISMIEINYSVHLNAEELEKVDTVKELFQLIESKE